MFRYLLCASKELFSKSLRLKIIAFTSLGLFTFHSSSAQQWNVLGNENQISSVASSYTSITVLGDVPYVVYVEGPSTGGLGKVKRKNSATGEWEQLGGDLASNISYTRIYSDKNNKLYVTYVDGNNSNRLAVVTFNTTTQSWVPLVSGDPFVSTGTVTYSISAFNSTPKSGLAFDSDNIPYISFSERSSGNPYVKRFINGAWETLGGGAVSTDITVANSIAIDDNDVPYIVYVKQSTATSTTGILKAFRLNLATNAWEDVSPPNPVPGGSSTTGATTAVRHSSIAMDAAYNPLVSYFNTSNSNRSTIIRFNRTTSAWNFIGTTGTRDAPYNSLVRDNGGNVYNAFTDLLVNGGTSPMARVFKLSNGLTTFTELKNSNLSRGIDSVSVSNLNLAVGSDTSKPYVVYTNKNSGGVTVPIVQMFNQPIITSPVTNITSTSATSGGEVKFDGGSAITERGIVYGTHLNPTTSDTRIKDASTGTGTFTSSVSGLSPATTYHVRAYAINSTGTVYGNNVTFTTVAPDPGSVIVQDNGSTVLLSNGIVKATISKSSATVTSLIYNGLELISGGYNGGQIYWSWNMPNFQEPSGCTYTLTADPHNNNFNYAEIKLHMSWNGSASTAAMDVDVYYSLPRNASGIYASATLSHPASYPALPGGEWRMASYPNPRFDWMSVDSLRNRIMPNGTDMDNSVSVPGAPPEVSRLTTGVYKDHYECKYDYSADFGAVDVWGWSSTTDNVGLWVTAPSKEYYPGGPMKRELMAHATPVLLNMLGGTHYGMGDNTSVAPGEDWQKNYGPFLIYCNKVAASTSNAPQALYEDAMAQAHTEQQAWPYTWYTNPNYAQENQRGAVRGKLVISDKGNPSAANIWVGVAAMPAGSTNPADFQHWSKNYQFWVKTDADGNFNIPHVLPGVYNFYAFGAAAAGQLTLTNAATVTAGNTTDLGTVTWTPTRVARTIWEIGTPDRTAMEYKHGTDWWTSNVYPDPRWGKFMNYTDEFPNDVNFTIGQSDIATDWNFVQPYNKSVQSSSPKWNVNFNLPLPPKEGSDASVYVALAENFSAALILTVNGVNVSSPSTGIIPGSSSNAMIRKGIHGAFAEVRFTFPASYLKAGDNQITFTLRITGGASSGEVMYDYLRLEADVPECTMPVFTTTPENIITATRLTGCDTVVNYSVEASAYPAPSYNYTFTGATTGSGQGTGSGSVFNQGTTTVTIAATNSCGTVNYNFDITVNDSIAPVITVPSSQFFCYSEKGYTIPALSAWDNCGIASLAYDISGATTRSGTGSDASGNFNAGISTITWTVTDIHNNQTTGTTTITVNPALAATIPDVYAVNQAADHKNTIYIGYGPSSLTISAAPGGGTPPYSYKWNGGQTTSSISVNSAGTYTVTITDAKGCAITASTEISVIDVTCGNNNNKVMVCHNGVVICVASAAVREHLNHGDALGACSTNSITSKPKLVEPGLLVAPALSVYPNPSAGAFVVQLQHYRATKAKVMILNISGQVILQKDITLTGGAQTAHLDISDQAQGVYVLKLVSADGTRTEKLVVHK